MNYNFLVVIISNLLNEYNSLFMSIKEIASFKIDIIDYDTLFSKKYKNQLKTYLPTDIIFVFHENYYLQKKNEITPAVHQLFRIFQPRILKLCSETSIFYGKNKKRIKKDIYFIKKGDDIKTQGLNFISCFLRIFHESTISFQLYDYLSASVKEMINAELLTTKQREIERLNKELNQKSKIDYLTSLYNRGAFYSILKKEIYRINRQLWRIKGTSVLDEKTKNKNISGPKGMVSDHLGNISFMMIDIDNFKNINDSYGHLVGDEVLKKFSNFLFYSNILRESDIVSRFGGEEFAILLPETNSENARTAAKHLCEKLRQLTFESENDQQFKITISIGVSEYYSTDTDENEMIRRADKALYWAKRHGRDQIVLFKDIGDFNE